MKRETLNKITDQIDYEAKGRLVGYLNIYNYSVLRKQPKLLSALDQYTLDGILLVLFIKLFWRKRISRKSPDFSSYFNDLFIHMNQNRTVAYFVGGSTGEIHNFVEVIKARYPKIEIAGFTDGYNVDNISLGNLLIRHKVEVTIVGMGTPKQEELMVDLRTKGYKGQSYSCGAFFSQTARKGVEYYPEFISKLHLRWAYRIYEEPKLFKRYAIQYPWGFLILLKDRIQSE